MVILGGVGCHGVVPKEDEILVCTFENAELRVSGRVTMHSTGENTNIPRPLIVGSSVAYLHTGQIIILGGGATCFSMGTFCKFLLDSYDLPGYGPLRCTLPALRPWEEHFRHPRPCLHV